MNSLVNHNFKIFFVVVLILLLNTTLFASIAKVKYIEGNVLVTNKAKKGFKKVVLDLEIDSNDVLRTHKKSKVKLQFNDGTIIVVGKNSTFSIESYLYDTKKENLSNAKFQLSKGIFKVITGAIGKVNPSKFRLKTTTATIGIRGTIIYADQKRVAFSEGKGFVRDIKKRKQVNIKAGQMTYTLKGKVPTTPIPITKRFQEIMNFLDRGTILKGTSKNTSSPLIHGEINSSNNTVIQNSSLNTNVTTKNINVGSGGNAQMGVIETQ